MIAERSRRDRENEALTDEPACEVDAASAYAIREKAVVADANEPGREHVQQKAPEELVDVESEELLGVAVCVVAIAEADTLAVEGDDAGVADGDAVGVVGQIREYLLGTCERRLTVHDPIGGTGASE